MDNNSELMTGKFCICNGKGFHIRFENGWTVSVQFGPGNYCDNYNYNMRIGYDNEKAGLEGSTTAECALINPNGQRVHREEWDDSVGRSMTPAKVLELMIEAATK